MSDTISTIDKFPYGFHFQTVLLGLAYREPNFFTQYEATLQPNFFDKEEYKHLCRVILSYYREYTNTPTEEFCYDLVTQYCFTKKFPEKTKERFFESLDQLLKVDLSGADWVKDKSIEFATAQAMKAALIAAVDTNTKSGLRDLDDPSKYSIILSRIEKALDIASPKNNGLRFRDVALTLPDLMRENSLYASSKKIKTGIPQLDDDMFGGATCGKIGVVLAPSGKGKSHALVSFGTNALREGHAVFHYTFGDLNVEEVFARYAANISGIDSRLIVEGVGPDYKGTMTRWLEDNQAELLIYYFPADTLTPSGLKSHISATIAKTGIRPKMVIVDYADMLATGLPLTFKSDEISAVTGIVYNQLIKIAYTFDCVVWTGSQVGKEHWNDEIIDSDAIARSVKKIEHSDYIITISQTKEERIIGKARLFEAKIRWGSDGHIIKVNLDRSRSRITTDDSVKNTLVPKSVDRKKLPSPEELGIGSEESMDRIQRLFERE